VVNVWCVCVRGWGGGRQRGGGLLELNKKRRPYCQNKSIVRRDVNSFRDSLHNTFSIPNQLPTLTSSPPSAGKRALNFSIGMDCIQIVPGPVSRQRNKRSDKAKPFSTYSNRRRSFNGLSPSSITQFFFLFLSLSSPSLVC
jgi:hypothetical protein